MNQSDSPYESDVDGGLLLAYIDGAVDPETRRRIQDRVARDPELRAEVESLAEMQRALERGLRAEAGPATQELGEYALGLLRPEEAAALEEWLAADPARRAEVERLRRYLAGPPLPVAPEAEPKRPGRIATIIAELAEGLAGLGGAAIAPVPAGLRGAGAAQAVYRVGDGQLVIEVQAAGPAVAQAPGKRTVLGLLIGFEGTESLTAALFRGDEMAATAACDELGNFELSDVAEGSYDLVLRAAEREILVPGLKVE